MSDGLRLSKDPFHFHDPRKFHWANSPLQSSPAGIPKIGLGVQVLSDFKASAIPRARRRWSSGLLRQPPGIPLRPLHLPRKGRDGHEPRVDPPLSAPRFRRAERQLKHTRNRRVGTRVEDSERKQFRKQSSHESMSRVFSRQVYSKCPSFSEAAVCRVRYDARPNVCHC